MWPEGSEKPQKLRTGLTTGTCATACCVAATELLFTGTPPERVTVTLPKGREVGLEIESCETRADAAFAATIKDAGDDPDVTHGARVFVELRLRAESGIRFVAGDGVGTVTRAGLALAVGEPAINRVPRKMMTGHLERQALRFGHDGGFEVVVGVDNGAMLALKTMNPRLGIVGGLSILGTTGIVRPYSCAAWVASIHQGLEVAVANGLVHVAASTGNTSESAIRDRYGFDDMALIEMGDFAGALLKHLKKVSLPRLSICGGFGKISKLACRNLDLNSRSSSIDFDYLAEIARKAGGDDRLAEAVRSANTSMLALEYCRDAGIEIADPICEDARLFAGGVTGNRTGVEVWAVDREGHFIGHAGFVS